MRWTNHHTESDETTSWINQNNYNLHQWIKTSEYNFVKQLCYLLFVYSNVILSIQFVLEGDHQLIFTNHLYIVHSIFLQYWLCLLLIHTSTSNHLYLFNRLFEFAFAECTNDVSESIRIFIPIAILTITW